MADLIRKALSAKHESKYIEFKQCFDTGSPRAWCEVIKDVVAIANSGGGIIVFGLDSLGRPTGDAVEAIAKIDPAESANQLSKYIRADLEFEIRKLKKGSELVALLIQGSSVPIVFEKPGSYRDDNNTQRTAFSAGTVYFRHGAKSEPGTSDDIRKMIERQLEHIRKSWISGVRRVVQAPAGAQIVTVFGGVGQSGLPRLANTVRAVNDPNALPVRLTREPTASGTFVHEEISEGIFDEINNVIEGNRSLARGQKHFFFGQPIYYRVYAERQHVRQSTESIALLIQAGASDFYAPYLFWTSSLPDNSIAELCKHLFLSSHVTQSHCLMRFAILLGREFCEWLWEKWHVVWKSDPQPPDFYWTFKKLIPKLATGDPRVIAARTSLTAQFTLPGEASIRVKELLETPEKAALMLSKACMRTFEGSNNLRSTARDLDYIAYGADIGKRASKLSKAIIATIGQNTPGNEIVGELVD